MDRVIWIAQAGGDRRLGRAGGCEQGRGGREACDGGAQGCALETGVQRYGWHT